MIKNDEKKEKDESFGCRKAVGRTIRPTAFCINENHSLGEWFKKSLLAIM